MKEYEGRYDDGVNYNYWRCQKCGEEVLDMKQLHETAKKYRKMKKHTAKISKWGMSLGLRIPKDLVKKYNFKENEEVTMIPEKEGIKIIPI
ncbi:MAG: AbrB/MazE/SpoVT family DNA-binding domain-containing protein [Candidatus Woesearchaeota archaeon]